MSLHSRNSPRKKLTACPRLGWTRHSPTGGSMRAPGLAESAYGVGFRCTRRGGSAVTRIAFVSAQIRVTGISIDPTVVVAHIAGPWPQPIDGWRRDLDRLPVTLREVAERAGGGCGDRRR